MLIDHVYFLNAGSNTHNNGAPGGDGQTGDAGEGRGGMYVDMLHVWSWTSLCIFMQDIHILNHAYIQTNIMSTGLNSVLE